MEKALLFASPLALTFIATVLILRRLIPFLKSKKMGQHILEIGPRWHKNKEGTPTMGGFMFIAGITLAVIVTYAGAAIGGALPVGGINRPLDFQLFSGLVLALAFGAMGFADDFVKVVKKRNLGLTAKQKLVIQFAIAILYLWNIRLGGTTVTAVRIPFFAAPWQLGWLYYPLCAIGIVFIVNSVNLTDGVDGLAASVTLMASLGFLGAAAVLHFSRVSLLAAATAGGCMGFLLYNAHPAKVFMGDTGSLALGGFVAASAYVLQMPLFIPIIGFIYAFELISVVMQVSYFKATHGKRIFRMTPIHHHFELCGWSETKIVTVFTIITILLCMTALAA